MPDDRVVAARPPLEPRPEPSRADSPPASRTAVLVCQGRAVAHGTVAVGWFSDPTAMELLHPDERAPVEVARGDTAPAGFGDRMEYEMLRAMAEVMATRTVAIDEAIRAAPSRQLVILGAGLDGRAWRMQELAGTDVFEVDHPASQADLRARLGRRASPARSVRFVPVDLARESLTVALECAGHLPGIVTTWVWEGVVPYLTPSEVREAVAAVSGRSAPGSHLCVNYQSRSLRATAGLKAMAMMRRVTRQHNPLADEPRRSEWSATSMGALLGTHGWRVVDDRDLLERAAAMPGFQPTRATSLRAGRVAIATRAA